MMSLNKLHNETALLEICDWEEEKVDKLLKNLNEALLDVSSSIYETLDHFCENQDYISKHSRKELFSLLENLIDSELKELSKTKQEYEN